MIKAIRGMRDILPPETSRWQWVESVAREVFDLYGYQEIRRPRFMSKASRLSFATSSTRRPLRSISKKRARSRGRRMALNISENYLWDAPKVRHFL